MIWQNGRRKAAMNFTGLGPLRGIVFLLTTAALLAQDSEALKFSVETQLVEIYVTVTQGNRRITDLRQEDFQLLEDKQPIAIDRLDSQKVPLQIALLLDVSESMREALPVTKEAAQEFVESLDPADRVTLIFFNSEMRYVTQTTSDRTPIVQAIRQSKAEGNTRLYDALLSAMKYLDGKKGRKAIVCFSDGQDTARTSSRTVVLNAAARYGYPVYAIGEGAGLEMESLKIILRQLSGVNGGKAYFVPDPNKLRSAFAEVASELRSAYVLNYYTQVPFDGKWHDLEVTTSHPEYVVHARTGFYARSAAMRSFLSDQAGSARSAPQAANVTAIAPAAKRGADGPQLRPLKIARVEGPAQDRTPRELARGDTDSPEDLIDQFDKARNGSDPKLILTALAALASAIPGHADVWFDLGITRLSLAQPKEAAEALRRAASLAPEDREIGIQLSRALLMSGALKDAARTLQQLARQHPSDLEILVELGKLYVSDRRLEEAYQTYRKAFDISLAPPLDLYPPLVHTARALNRTREADLLSKEYLDRGGNPEKIN
jgi:VWFA-related protein